MEPARDGEACLRMKSGWLEDAKREGRGAKGSIPKSCEACAGSGMVCSGRRGCSHLLGGNFLHCVEGDARLDGEEDHGAELWRQSADGRRQHGARLR